MIELALAAEEWRVLMSKLFAAVLVTAFTCLSTYAHSHDDSEKLLLENEQMRAVEYQIQAGGKVSLESHAPCLFFTVNPFVGTVKFKNGKSVTSNFKIDDPRFYYNPIIGVANSGRTEAKFLILELKKPAPLNPRELPEDDGTKVAADVYRVLFENNYLRVIRVGSQPGQKTLMHSHPGSAFRYSMANINARLTMPDGTSREVENINGVSRWTELPTRHIIENIGRTEGHTLLVEIK